MNLHIFNPEHDIALAAHGRQFTAPHAARKLRHDLGFLPAIWAERGDLVLVDDVAVAREACRRRKSYTHEVEFVTMTDLAHWEAASCHLNILPWGWDHSLRQSLLRANEGFRPWLPTEEAMTAIHLMSNRKYAAFTLLPQLVALDDRLVGSSTFCFTNVADVEMLCGSGKSVLKAPWSSSGRGVRFVDGTIDTSLRGWVTNVIRQQGGIMVEPYYNKVKDFGMEFTANPDGSISYDGLSLFSTMRGAYTGSIVATEEMKRSLMEKYLPLELLDAVCDKIKNCLKNMLKDIYVGPFGIDMMVVAHPSSDGFLLHPCVEMNLRRTMGHVALALSHRESTKYRLMSITHADNYRLHLKTLYGME